MATFSFEEAMGSTAAPAAPSLPAPVSAPAGGKQFSFEEAMGAPVPVSSVKPADDPNWPLKDTLKEHGAKFQKEFAKGASSLGTVADMLVGFPWQVWSTMAEADKLQQLRTYNKLAGANGMKTLSRKEMEDQAATVRNEILLRSPTFFTQLADTLKAPTDTTQGNPVAHAMETVSKLLDEQGGQIEYLTGGRFTRNNFNAAVNGVFAGLGLTGAVAPMKGAAKAQQARADAALKTTNFPIVEEPPKESRPVDYTYVPAAHDIPAPEAVAKWKERTDAATSAAETKTNYSDLDRMRTAEQMASRLMAEGASVKRVEAIVAKNPLVGEAMAAIRARRAAVVDSRLGTVQQFGASDILDPNQGKPGAPALEPPGGRVAPEGTPTPGTSLSVPKTVAAVAAGAAAAYGLSQMDSDQAAIAAMAPVAFVAGRGKGLTLEELRAVPPETSLGTLLDRSSYTLKTLDRLPKNRTEFPVQMVRDQLKRQDVSAPEKAILEKVLEGKEKVTAKDLITSMKEQTQSWELTPKKTDTYADYGLENIDRAQPNPDFSLRDVREARLEHASSNGTLYQVITPDGEILDSLVIQAGEDQAAALAKWKTEAEAIFDGPEASTNLYRLPDHMQMSANNHFGDPQLFGWTRSFDEKGVRHVVEIQSDLAQHAGKVLSEEERAAATNAQAEGLTRAQMLRDLGEQLLPFEKFNPVGPLTYTPSTTLVPLLDKLPSGVKTNFLRNLARQLDLSESAAEGAGTYVLRVLDERAYGGPERTWRKVHDALSQSVRRYEIAAAEAEAKLGEVANTSKLSPILKTWPKRLVREELARAATERAKLEDLRRGQIIARDREPAPGTSPEDAADHVKFYDGLIATTQKNVDGLKTVRFATADTVAKVEGWPEIGRDYLDGVRTRVSVAAEGVRRAERFVQDGISSEDSLLAARERLSAAQKELDAATSGKGPKYSPAHQGIYDRYKKDIEKFLVQQGGTPYTDSAGHTWIEVPTDRYAMKPTEMLAAAGVGAALAYAISEDKGDEAASLAAFLAIPRGLKRAGRQALDLAKQPIQGADYVAGVMSTRVRNISPAIHHRVVGFFERTLADTHKGIQQADTFLRQVDKFPTVVKKQLERALTSNEESVTLDLIRRYGPPSMGAEWNKVKALLDDYRRKLQDEGIITAWRENYFPRIVKDYEGLKAELNSTVASRLDELLKNAEKRSIAGGNGPLSELERSVIINKHIRNYGFGDGKPGFSKQRAIDVIDEKLLPYYASPAEAIHSYIRYSTEAYEKSRLFGKNLVKNVEEGRVTIDLDKSIGSLVKEHYDAGKFSAEQAHELSGILESLFGKGASSPSGLMQDLRNLGYFGTMGDPASAVIQPTDLFVTVAVQGMKPTLTALAEMLTGKARFGRRDFGLVDHISEEFVSKRLTAKILNRTFRYVGLEHLDAFGKVAAMNAALHKAQAQARTPRGEAALARKYGEAYGSDFGPLMEELRSKQIGPHTTSLVFHELSDLQPVTRFEMPQAWADHPNGRILFSLKSWVIKQADVVRREAYNQIRTGGQGGVQRGLASITKIATAMTLAGLSSDAIRDFILGREWDFKTTDAFYAFTKTFGWSEYTVRAMDEAKQKGKSQLTAAGVSLVSPPALQVLEDLWNGPANGEWSKFFQRLPYGRTAVANFGDDFGSKYGKDAVNARAEARKEKAARAAEDDPDIKALEKELRRLEKEAK